MYRPSLPKFPSRLHRLGVCLSLSLAVAGCAVGPDYFRPFSTLPEMFRSTASETVAVPESETIESAWWRRFGDPLLDELVSKARTQNFDLRAAIARVEEAEGLAAEAGATFFPQIDLKGSSTRSQVSTLNVMPLSSSVPRLQDSRKAGLATSFELDLWGKLRRADESARADLLASRYAQDALALSITGSVVSSYLSLRAADANLLLTQDSLDSRRKSLALVQARFEAGSSSLLEINQAEGSLAAVEAQLADLRRQRALIESQLALLTGQPDLRILPGRLADLPLPPVPPAGLPSSLLEARPDVRQAEEALISANARIGVAKAAYFPSLTLTGSYGGESAALADLFKSGARVWSLGLAATMPLFDAGRTSARVDQATARQKQALASYQKTVHSAFKDVNDALVGLREYAESDQAQEKRAEAARKTLNLAQIRYEAGYIGFLDVLDAQRTANDAQLAAVTTRQARLGATVDLFKALGGGWNDDFAEASRRNTGVGKAPVVTPGKS